MSRSTFRVLFYLKRNAPKKNGLVPVMCRITVNGKISQFSCKLDVEEKLWDVNLGRMSGRSVVAQETNQMLDKIRVGINKAYQEIMDRDGYVSATDIAELTTGRYIRDGRTIIINGATGTGKSYFACALGERACRQGTKTLYFTMNMLIENLRLVHLEGRETNFFRKLMAHDLLIINDFGMVRLEGQLQHDFEQIIDDRYNRKALILASQLPVADWYDVFQSELIAEACLDRLVHKSSRFELKGESLRKKY